MIKRCELHGQLPLQTPFSLHIFPAYFCNFKCKYCLHSLPEDVLQHKGFIRQFMPMDIYKKAIDSLQGFPQKLKALIFAGHGEPLLHRHIAEMVAYAKDRNVADRVEIVTNGSLLTCELSDALIQTGLDRLRVSVQGIDGRAYEAVMGRNFDFDGFVGKLRYFYAHKKTTDVYCKIIDVALRHPEEEKIFYDIFSSVADETAVEYEIPFVQEVDNEAMKPDFLCTKQGTTAKQTKVCAMPFYMLVLTPNGDVVPCCSTDVPIVWGNVREKGLPEIWHGSMANGFRRLQLLGNRFKHPVCSGCSVPQYGMQTGDYLDEYAERLLDYYGVMDVRDV